MPIGLPQLARIYSSEAIRECVNKALAAFRLTAQKLGYFVLDNAPNNNRAVKYLGS